MGHLNFTMSYLTIKLLFSVTWGLIVKTVKASFREKDKGKANRVWSEQYAYLFQIFSTS